ncbi:DUF3313 family protein [Niveibacterium terrae]|uniref:DUF3313 family protein n=1 Tax=Niveibacterium terrae TaxID=3373598 RepID=UPI003A8F64D4
MPNLHPGIFAPYGFSLLFGAWAGACLAQTAADLTVAGDDAHPPRLSHYECAIIDPVTLSTPDEEHWKGVSEALRVEAAKQTLAEFTRVVEAKLPLADKPCANALRLRLRVEDVRLSSPVAASIGHLLPIGLVLNAGRSASGGTAPKNMGQVTISGELRDANLDMLLASFETRQGPDAFDVASVVSQQTAMNAAISRAAGKFAEALKKARKLEPGCAAENAAQGTVELKAPDCSASARGSSEAPQQNSDASAPR